ncbi:MAG: hypothetical protein ABI378_02280 [Chitinophagaceae bacterium]
MRSSVNPSSVSNSSESESLLQIAEWARVVSEMVQENNLLKRRLSSFINDNKSSGKILDILEAFHSSFLIKDTHLALLIQDIRKQEMFAKALANEKVKDLNFDFQQKRLHFEVVMMQEQFLKQKDAFEVLISAHSK